MEISAAEFKAKCLKLMDEIAKTHKPIVITKRGKPVAKLVPVEPQPRKPLFGCMADPRTAGGREFDLDGGGARLKVVRQDAPSRVENGPAILKYKGPRIPIAQMHAAFAYLFEDERDCSGLGRGID